MDEQEIQAIASEHEPALKEVQGTIMPLQVFNQKVSEDELFSVLKQVAPGTQLRTAIDGALRAGKGALLVIENEHLIPIIDGGFRVNCRFTPQRLVELCKMDGALIIAADVKRINYANVLLTPDSSIKTLETGTRHKAAERTARQIGTLVIAISERRNEVTLYYKNMRYPLKATDEIRRKANEHLQTIEKQREVFDIQVDKLNQLELKNHPSAQKAVLVVQKGRLIQKIAEEMKRFLVELGVESMLLKTRLKELVTGVEKETNLVIKDYTKLDVKKSKLLLETLSYDELLDIDNITRILGYDTLHHTPIKGWRILDKTFLEEPQIAEIIKNAGTLEKTVKSPEIHAALLDYQHITQLKEDLDKIRFNN